MPTAHSSGSAAVPASTAASTTGEARAALRKPAPASHKGPPTTPVAGASLHSIGKSRHGNFFEDFEPGQRLVHATPRTIGAGEVALYSALYGTRTAVHACDHFARRIGLPASPVDDLLVFHLVFGKTVPDISVNAVANLGYADGRFGVAVYPGDSLRAVSEVIGLKQNSNGTTGTVYVRTVGLNQREEVVLEYTRWVMVKKRYPGSESPAPAVPTLPAVVPMADLVIPPDLRLADYDAVLAGSHHGFDDYAVGERIDHVDGMTITDSDHMTATRLYQNTAKVHFNHHAEADGRFGKPIVYGGHVISMARAFAFNGLANAFKLAAIHAGTHVAPAFAGDTIYAWSEVIDRHAFTERTDLGALRLRTVATKNRTCEGHPYRDEQGRYERDVVLDFDYTVLMPRWQAPARAQA